MILLPQEIQDKIFLYLDYSTLVKCRDLQSKYVINTTLYNNLSDAAENGDLGNMKWLKEQGCTWDRDTFACAVKNGDLKVIKWLKEQGCDWGMNTFDIVAEHGDLENMKWLKEQGCPWDNCTEYAMDFAARCGHLDVVMWLNHNRTEGCTYLAMNHVAKYGHLEIVKFLHENRTEGCTKNAMDFTVQNSHLDVVSWLHDILYQFYIAFFF